MEPLAARDEAVPVEQPLGGSREAFGRLVRDHEVAVRGFLFRVLRDPALADDLAQDAFLTAYRELGEYRGGSSVRTWLIAIARNLARQYLRAANRRRLREEEMLRVQLAQWRMDRAGAEPWDEEAQERVLAALGECLAALAPESRRIIQEHYFQGQTIAEIAQRQGRKGSAVRMMLFRTRQVLRNCLRKRLGRGSEPDGA